MLLGGWALGPPAGALERSFLCASACAAAALEGRALQRSDRLGVQRSFDSCTGSDTPPHTSGCPAQTLRSGVESPRALDVGAARSQRPDSALAGDSAGPASSRAHGGSTGGSGISTSVIQILAQRSSSSRRYSLPGHLCSPHRHASSSTLTGIRQATPPPLSAASNPQAWPRHPEQLRPQPFAISTTLPPGQGQELRQGQGQPWGQGRTWAPGLHGRRQATFAGGPGPGRAAPSGGLALDGPVGRSYHAMTPALRADIQSAALKKQTGVSLKYLLDFGTQPLERQMLLSARFLHNELPIRLAHRLMDLNALPPGLSDEPHVRRVKGWYAESFADFRAFPPIKDNLDVVRFTAMLKNAFRRHNNVVPAIAKGVEVYKRALEASGESTLERESEIQHFLDTFFLSRIAIRFLAGHHISMFEPPRADHIGLVHTKCNPHQVASDAVAEARAICFREYGGAPPVSMLGNSELTMAYVPSHLHHMVFELVKNSLRAVQERYADSDTDPPPIQVVVAQGLEDVTIKVSDQGGGIPRSGLNRKWTYLYTTARSPLPEVDIDSSNMPAVLAGYGCGLPLSRLYARYFGGDLQVISMEGYGTDAYLHLARLGNDEEPLPGAV